MRILQSCKISGRIQEDELYKGNIVPKTFKELLSKVTNKNVLLSEDWKLLREDASDTGSLDGVLTASFKLNCDPPREVLENLLLTALCTGECDTAVNTSKELQRKLERDESLLLMEGAILTGKVEEFVTHVPVFNMTTLAMIHTTVAIAACRSLRQKRCGILPARVNLHTWNNVYVKELVHFDVLTAKYHMSSSFLPGFYLIFEKEPLSKLIGALLVDDLISREIAETILVLTP